jgi:drug/metabolite transporter (DMT)-like permease
MLISFFLLRERIQIKQVLGTVVGLVGIITIVLTPLFKNGLDSSLSGNLFLIIATLGGVIHVILTKEIANKYKPVCIVFYSFIIGTLSFTPGFVWEIKEYGFLTDINLSGIIGIAFGAVFASAIAYSLQEWALEYLRASEVGLFTYMDPVVAVLIAVPLLGEIPTPEFLVGSFLVFMGIFIAEKMALDKSLCGFSSGSKFPNATASAESEDPTVDLATYTTCASLLSPSISL